MTPFDAVLIAFRKERDMIKKAPWSFAIICSLAIGFIWMGFHYAYRTRLEDLTQDREHWKSEADYWEKQVNHPKPDPEKTAPSPIAQQNPALPPPRKIHVPKPDPP